MRVLHIAGGFAQQPLYMSLVEALRALGHRQAIFAPVRSAQELTRQPAEVPGELAYRFEHILKPYHRVLFRKKIGVILARLLACFEPRDFDVVHAHTLYSDGAVALELSRRFGLPYLAAVRNTDVNFFMRLRPDLRRRMGSIVMRAGRVVFLSPAYRADLVRRLRGDLRSKLETDSVVIPNGLGRDWLDAVPPRTSPEGDTLRLLFVGSFTPAKNVSRVLDAAAIVARQRPLELSLVGSGGKEESRILRALSTGRYPFARHLGRVSDPDALRTIYRSHDVLVMPSIRETFGMVYLEAISQGLPIVHSVGQGVDGYFQPGTIAEAVDPRNVTQIAESIEALAKRLGEVRALCLTEAQRFAWDRVANRYDGLYRAIISGDSGS